MAGCSWLAYCMMCKQVKVHSLLSLVSTPYILVSKKVFIMHPGSGENKSPQCFTHPISFTDKGLTLVKDQNEGKRKDIGLVLQPSHASPKIKQGDCVPRIFIIITNALSWQNSKEQCLSINIIEFYASKQTYTSFSLQPA